MSSCSDEPVVKSEARRRAKELWQQLLSDNRRKEALLANLEPLIMSHKQGAIILVTYPLPDELDLRLLLYRSEAQLFLPRVVSRGEMEFRLWRDEGRELFAPEPGWHGIVGGAAAAPLLASDLLRSDARACGERRLALIPALALNRHFRRLGRGGGFYDRWKKRLDAWQKVALLPEELIEVNFTAEEHDLIVDAVVTDNGIREQDNSRTGLSDI